MVLRVTNYTEIIEGIVSTVVSLLNLVDWLPTNVLEVHLLTIYTPLRLTVVAVLRSMISPPWVVVNPDGWKDIAGIAVVVAEGAEVADEDVRCAFL